MLQTFASPLNVRVVQEAATHVGSEYLLAEVSLAAMSIWNLGFLSRCPARYLPAHQFLAALNT